MPQIYWIVDMSSIVWLLYCKLIIEGFPPTSPLFLLPTIKPTHWLCVIVNNCTNKTSRSFNTREQCYAFVPTWKCSVYYSKTAQGLKLKQMLWLQSFGTPTRKQINNPCFLPSRNVYFLQMCVIWCGFQWNSLFFSFSFFSFCWAGLSARKEAVALPVELLWHVWGSCALVHRPTVQTAAWPSALQTENHRQDDCGFDGQRKQRGPRKQTQTPRRYDRRTNSPPRRRINKNTDFHTLDWNHVCSLQTSALHKLQRVKWWKTQNGGPGWGFRGTWPYSTVITCAVMLRWSWWCRDT